MQPLGVNTHLKGYQGVARKGKKRCEYFPLFLSAPLNTTPFLINDSQKPLENQHFWECRPPVSPMAFTGLLTLILLQENVVIWRSAGETSKRYRGPRRLTLPEVLVSQWPSTSGGQFFKHEVGPQKIYTRCTFIFSRKSLPGERFHSKKVTLNGSKWF